MQFMYTRKSEIGAYYYLFQNFHPTVLRKSAVLQEQIPNPQLCPTAISNQFEELSEDRYQKVLSSFSSSNQKHAKK